MKKSLHNLLVYIPTEQTKIFCIEEVLNSVLKMNVPEKSSLLITTGKNDPIASQIQNYLHERGEGNFSNIFLKTLFSIRDKTIWDKEGFKPLTFQRNYALRIARGFNFQELMFIDSDIEVPKNSYNKLHDIHADIAGGYYESRFFDEQPFFGNKGKEGQIIFPRKNIDYKIGDILLVDYIGVGCSVLSRKLIENVEFPSTTYEAEDIAFLNEAHKKDMVIKIHTGVQCVHHSLFNERITKEDKEIFSAIAWSAYEVLGNYIIKDERINKDQFLNCSNNYFCKDIDFPVLAVQTNKGYYPILNKNINLDFKKEVNAFVFIPREKINSSSLDILCTNIKNIMENR